MTLNVVSLYKKIIVHNVIGYQTSIVPVKAV